MKRRSRRNVPPLTLDAARGMLRRKPEVITFKADPALVEAMKNIPNRSEFIRTAVLAAMGNLCPLCQGTGMLTPKQQVHWQAFAETHAVQQCKECHELHVVCQRSPVKRKSHGRRRK
ncbi:MAG: CopG family transcriptional regulator [Planctomycetota bacterium]|nr:CopG family transcriptional regulator [Planctomycetota bacterium]